MAANGNKKHLNIISRIVNSIRYQERKSNLLLFFNISRKNKRGEVLINCLQLKISDQLQSLAADFIEELEGE